MIEETKKRIQSLSESQQKILARRLTQSMRKSSKIEIPRQNRETNTFPLSFAQHRLWFLDQLVSSSTFFNLVAACQLNGILNVGALQQSLEELARRHEVLRTTFMDGSSGPLQVIGPTTKVELPLLDITTIPGDEQKAEFQRLVRKECQQAFDLARGPLFRLHLIKFAANEWMLLLTMHHIVSDLWSMGVLFRDLGILYGVFSGKETLPTALPDLPIQYADFSVWQRQYLSGKVLEEHLKYWQGKLTGAATLQLPMDQPRPAVQTFHGARESLVLPGSIGEALKAFRHSEGATLFMTLLAAFAVLLHRYTGQNDIVVGSPIANRNRPETEGLIGFFVNMLVLRIDVSGNPSFRRLLARVREMALGAYKHQDLPFEKLVEELQPDRDMSRNPLFQVTFGLLNPPTELRKGLGDLTLSLIPTQIETARFDLEVDVWEGQEDLSIRFIYNTDLFEGGTIKRMLGHFRNVIEGIVADPDQRIATLPMIGDAERHQLLIEWNQTATQYPRDATIHELFERQVGETPDAVALVCGDRQMTYGELNARANRLAHHLIKLGVGPEVMVGICVERGLEMVVGVLGILKAGGAYVPLDPVYPGQRLAFMLEDTKSPVLLTQTSLQEQLADYSGTLICLDGQWEQISQEPSDNQYSGATTDNLAYVIYTSGSTGQPKGVAIPHRAVNRLVCNTDYVQIMALDRVVQASNTSFDAATFEIWGTLLHGARLVGVAREVTLDPKAFADFLDRQQITVMFITTALFNQMAREAPEAFHGLRALLFGGEAVDPGWVREVLSNDPPQRLLHVYGPTETTTFATWHRIEEVPEGAVTLPIGRPIANTQAYVLDRYLKPMPVGIYGELYIGGDGLAREYLNQPELTAERFIPNPFSDEPSDNIGGSRLYKTGDAVRYLQDGSIEFQGRFDHQVKIRGFRVELGEIEATLAQHPAVDETVVLCREDIPGDKRLVAYVVMDHESDFTIGELRGFLSQKLPGYMVPAAFVVLDALPLTPNGKIDRKALPLPDGDRPDLEAGFTPPQTETEKSIAAIWREVLQLEKIGIHDDFFDLGGHSLLATQIMSRLNAAFDLELPLRILFEFPTVSNLAKYIDTTLRAGRDHSLSSSTAHSPQEREEWTI